MVPVAFFPVTSPVSETFAYLALVLCAHYTICRYMFTVGFQYYFRQIIARFSAGRRKQFVVSDMLLFWCSWFKYRFIKLDLVTVGKFCFHFSRVHDSVVDCVNVSPSARLELNHSLRDAQNACALTKSRHRPSMETIINSWFDAKTQQQYLQIVSLTVPRLYLHVQYTHACKYVQ